MVGKFVELVSPMRAALVELTTGAPYPMYHGGLLHARVTYYDPERRRPGLPEDVTALVEAVDPEGFRLQLVNLSPQEGRRVIARAGHRPQEKGDAGAPHAQPEREQEERMIRWGGDGGPRARR